MSNVRQSSMNRSVPACRGVVNSGIVESGWAVYLLKNAVICCVLVGNSLLKKSMAPVTLAAGSSPDSSSYRRVG